LGADHDENAGCSSGYVMSKSGTDASDENAQFSSCSLGVVSANLTTLVANPMKNCFQQVSRKSDGRDFSFCGDEIVSGEEECDCGLRYWDCDDPCCYAAHINPEDKALNE